MYLKILQAEQTIETKAYDCSINSNMGIREIDRTFVKECRNETKKYKSGEMTAIQLVMKRKYIEIEIYNCLVTVTMKAAYCGWDGFYTNTWPFITNMKNKKIKVTSSACKKAVNNMNNILHNKLNVQIDYLPTTHRHMLHQIPININGVGNLEVYPIGNIEINGKSCTGKEFFIGQQKFEKHVLKVELKAKIQKLKGKYHTDLNVLYLQNNLMTGNIYKESVSDGQTGDYYWSAKDNGDLERQAFVEILRGTGQIYRPHENFKEYTPIITIEAKYDNNETKRIALTLTKNLNICIANICKNAYITNMKNFIVLTNFGSYHNDSQPSITSTVNLDKISDSDIDDYTNIKAALNTMFITQELNLDSSFLQISLMICKINRDLILQDIEKLSLINTGQNGIQGKLIIDTASALIIMQCKLIYVKINTKATAKECYLDLPIIYFNETSKSEVAMYLHPVTLIIKPLPRKVKCSIMFSPKFKITNKYGIETWICSSKLGFIPCAKQPEVLSPLQTPGGLYQNQIPLLKHIDIITEQERQNAKNRQFENIREASELSELVSLFTGESDQERIHQYKSIIFKTLSENGVNTDDLFIQFLPFILRMIIAIISNIWYFVLTSYIINIILKLSACLKTMKQSYKTNGITINLLLSTIISILLCLLCIDPGNDNRETVKKEIMCELKQQTEMGELKELSTRFIK